MSLGGPLIWFGVVQAVIYLLFIRAIDLYEREPLRYVIPVFVWGFAVATTVSLIFNTLFELTLSSITSVRTANFFTAVVEAPIVEECSKGLALLIIFFIAYLARRRTGLIEFSGVMDGIVYGSAVGFGFAIAEDLLYGVQFGAETFIVRRIFGGFAHASFTSLTGIGIGLIPWVHSRILKVVLPVLGLCGAILLHATFNFTATVFGPVGYLFLLFVVLTYVLVIIVWLAIERRAIRQELREEVPAGTITPQQYAMLPSYFRTTGHYLGLIFTGKLGTWFRARKLNAAAVDLALAKRLARRTGSPGSMDRVRTLRRKILDLREGATVRAAS
ncbi:MAG: PrsW family intramembrane metalloprotease [Actinomycetota bacterium]|nr:PrsW family intramembrane metalloprotease [Actinomycetota bacterium]